MVDKVYDAIKNKSMFILANMNGVTSASAWDSVKDNIADALNAITHDLNASKPVGVI